MQVQVISWASTIVSVAGYAVVFSLILWVIVGIVKDMFKD
jgi:hypothetical protein